MESTTMGQLIALIGLILLVATSLQRQSARRRKVRLSPQALAWQKWGSLAAYALIAVGLYLMIDRK
jgi:uncharacterized membrane protein